MFFVFSNVSVYEVLLYIYIYTHIFLIYICDLFSGKILWSVIPLTVVTWLWLFQVSFNTFSFRNRRLSVANSEFSLIKALVGDIFYNFTHSFTFHQPLFVFYCPVCSMSLKVEWNLTFLKVSYFSKCERLLTFKFITSNGITFILSPLLTHPHLGHEYDDRSVD